MTPGQIAAIQQSFAKVVPMSEQAAILFYGRLFQIEPTVKPLFRGDMTEQGRHLMATLSVVVTGLVNLESLLPAASALAKRHVDYGVKAADYQPVGAALLWTLERGLAEQWTPQLVAAWTEAYTILANFMISEAYGRSLAAERVERPDHGLNNVDCCGLLFSRLSVARPDSPRGYLPVRL